MQASLKQGRRGLPGRAAEDALPADGDQTHRPLRSMNSSNMPGLRELKVWPLVAFLSPDECI